MLRCYAIEAGALRFVPADASGPIPPEAAWIDLAQPTRAEGEALERLLGIDIPTREESRGLQTSNRLTSSDDTLYLSALVPVGPDATTPTIPVTFVRTGDRLVTVRYSEVEALDPLIRRCLSGEMHVGSAADVFAGLLGTIVDRIANQLERVGETLDRIGHGIFRPRVAVTRRASPLQPIPQRTQGLEATIEEIGQAHEISAKLRESLQSLIRLVAFAREHADDGLRHRLKAIDTDLRSAAEHNAYLDADMEFMLDATVGLIGIQQNKVIYILSIVSVALTPPVLVASTYGMNFRNMPELGWTIGYPWALALMLISAIAPFLFFKLKGWL